MEVFSTFKKFVNRYSALIVISSAFALTGVANAAGAQLTVSPDTNIKDGDTVMVSGTGFLAGAPGGISECNGAPTTGSDPQPLVTLPGTTDQVPVGCTNPFAKLVPADGSGNLPSTSFVVHTGVIGPPATGTDSAGNSAATDAEKYPCPPTAAQIAAGISCQISYGNSPTLNSSTNIAFYTAPTGGGTTTPPAAPAQSNTNSNTNSATSSTTASSASSASQLANTGPGNVALVASILAAITGAAAFLAYSYKKARN